MYCERLEFYLADNSVAQKQQKRSVLWSISGPATSAIIHWCAAISHWRCRKLYRDFRHVSESSDQMRLSLILYPTCVSDLSCFASKWGKLTMVYAWASSNSLQSNRRQCFQIWSFTAKRKICHCTVGFPVKPRDWISCKITRGSALKYDFFISLWSCVIPFIFFCTLATNKWQLSVSARLCRSFLCPCLCAFSSCERNWILLCIRVNMLNDVGVDYAKSSLHCWIFYQCVHLGSCIFSKQDAVLFFCS